MLTLIGECINTDTVKSMLQY